MTISDLAGHIAFGLIALSFVVTRILWLRAISVVASVAAILYNYIAPDRPLWLVIGWNVVFILVNGWQIFKLLRERRPIAFAEDEQSLYDLVFSNLKPAKFKSVLDAGHWTDYQQGELILEEGADHEEMMIIARGRVSVEKEGARVSELGCGAFVGEMSYVRESASNATVRAVEATRCLRWAKETLDQLFEKDDELRAVFHSEITADLAEKLALQKRHNEDVVFARK